MDTNFSAQFQNLPNFDVANSGMKGVTPIPNYDPAVVPEYVNLDLKQTNTPGVQAVQDPKGRITLTNVFAKESSVANDPSVEFGSKMRLIQQEKDFDAKQAMLGDLQSSFAVYGTERLQRAQNMAENRLGVNALRKQLIDNERLDRTDPKWAQYQSDSKITASVRERLRLAEMQSFQMADGIMKSDPEFLRHATLLTSFVKLQERLLQDQLQKQGIRSQEVEAITATLTEDNKAAIRAMYPELKTDDELKLRAAQLMKNPQFRQESSVILDPSAKPEDYLTAAVSGVSMAEPYVIQQQSRLMGQSHESVQQEIKMAKEMVNDPKSLEIFVNKFGSPQEREAVKVMQGQALLLKGKEEQRAHYLTKVNTVIGLMKRSKERTFMNDVSTWKPVDGQSLQDIPELNVLFTTKAAQKQSVSFDELFKNYVGGAPQELMAERAALLQKHIFNNGTQLNTGVYGQIVNMATLKSKTQAAILAAMSKRKTDEAMIPNNFHSVSPLVF